MKHLLGFFNLLFLPNIGLDISDSRDDKDEPPKIEETVEREDNIHKDWEQENGDYSPEMKT